MKIRSYLAYLLLVSFLFSFAACDRAQESLFPEEQELREERAYRDQRGKEVEQVEPKPLETLFDTSAKPELKKRELNLLVVGDILMHVPLINAARTEDGSYDFTTSYRYLWDDIEAADYACFNMEGTLAGEPWEGFPLFSCPDELAEQMYAMGFDLAFAANNHSIDRGTEGLIMTAQKLKAAGLDLVGTRESSDDMKYLLKEVNGIKLAFLNYTFESKLKDGKHTLNGHIIEDEARDLVDSFSVQREPEDLFSQDLLKIGERLSEVKAEQADFIIVLLHWGYEYHNEPNAYQLELAQFLADSGVDLVVGAGPHVLQPIQWLERPDGGQMLCYYSLGNFISNQHFKTKKSKGHAEDGLMALIRLEKNIRGDCQIAKAGYLATYCSKIKPDKETTYASLIPVARALKDMSEFELTEKAERRVLKSSERTARVMANNGEGIESYASVAEFIEAD
ncbi:MAG: CapA family protein [Eubacteriales bacterium]|nr:CapA family protein [Eubacteriales bacterium]